MSNKTQIDFDRIGQGPLVEQLSGLKIRSLDVMQNTKDTVTNQINKTEVINYLSCIVTNFKPTHVAVSYPFDSNSDFVSYGSTPRPQTIEQCFKFWCDTIHGLGSNVLFRGTWCAMENIWSCAFDKGATPLGTVASAPTDGQSTWLGKCYSWIVNHPGYFKDGDIYAPCPEQTTYVFNGDTFLGSSDIQNLYAQFFNNLIIVATQAFATIGKKVTVGYTSNNYSEIRSGWMPGSIFTNSGICAVDYYGNYNNDSDYTVAAYERDLRLIHTSSGKPLFWQEWGDIVTFGESDQARYVYFAAMMDMIKRLVAEGIIMGFNYWGMWQDTDNTGIMIRNSDGTYTLDGRGQLLASLYNPGLQNNVGAITQSQVDQLNGV